MEKPHALTRNIHPFDFDAFSHGQIGSKIWLCERIESYLKTHFNRPISISIYGSWVGLLPFLLLSRGHIQIQQLDLYDIDPDAQQTAKKILDYWKFTPNLKINFHEKDCNDLILDSTETDLVINTSCEHMDSLNWWKQLPEKTHFCLQSTNMLHPTHVSTPESLQSWIESLSLKSHQIHWSGEQFTSYPAFSFSRWMLLGRK